MKPFPIATIGTIAAVAAGVWLLFPGEREPRGEPHVSPAEDQPAEVTNNSKPDNAAVWSEVVVSPEISRAELLELTRRLVALDARGALVWAQSQTDLQLRPRIMAVVFEAWAERDCKAAVAAALEQNESDRFLSLEGALNGAAKTPAQAVELVRELLARNSDQGPSCAAMLIGSLSRAGEFQSALGLLNDLPASLRSNDVRGIFDLWGQTQPGEAARALDAISDAAIRASAFTAMIEGWSRKDPGALADYALTQAAGEERLRALEMAIERWTLIDPAAMAAWLGRSADESTRDFGAATMLLRTDQVNRGTETAMAWVETIRDPELRLVALAHVTREWAQQNRGEAEQYLRVTDKLDDTQRAWLMQNLSDREGAIQDFPGR